MSFSSKLKTILLTATNKGLSAALSEINNHLKFKNSYLTIVTSQIKVPAFFLSYKYNLIYNLSFTECKKLAVDRERSIILDILDNLEPDSTFYDIGANKGDYALKASEVLSSGTIVAIEPGGIINKITDKNRENIISIQKRVSEDSEEKSFMSGGQVTKDGDVETEIPNITGDDIIKNNDYPAPDVIKIDVNG